MGSPPLKQLFVCMINRLLQGIWSLLLIVSFDFLSAPSDRLVAQTSFFNFTPPTNLTLAVGNDCATSLAAGGLGMPVVTSTIGANVIINQFDPVASGYLYTDLWPAPYNNLVVVWKVGDNQGHVANFSFTVSIVDLTPPVFNTASFPTPLQLNSVVQVPTNTFLPATDNCTNPNSLVRTFTETARPDTCASGTFTRTWTASDVSGNLAVYTQTIVIYKDSLPPSISVFPQNGASSCTQLTNAYPAWLAAQMSSFTASDPSGILSYTNNAPPLFPPGCKAPLTVTFWATDNCLIAIPTTAVFSTSDNQPPVILSPPKDTVAYCTSTGSPLVEIGKWISKKGYLSALDSCTEQSLLQYEMRIGGVVKDSAQVVAELLASYGNGCGTMQIGSKQYQKVRGKVTVSFFVIDACGKKTNAGTASFGVIDTVPPILTGSNISELCGGNDSGVLNAWINNHGNISASDGCSSVIWSSFDWSTSSGVLGSGNFGTGPYPAIPAHNCSWFVDVTFKARDDCGNLQEKTLRFQLIDTIKPVISGFPPVITLPCTNPNPVLLPVYVSDNCDTSMLISYTAVNSDSSCAGTYKRTITWSAQDDCGNIGKEVQIVLVQDTVGPIFTLVPANYTVGCDTFELPPLPIQGVNIQATDACSPVMSITTQVISNQNPNPQVCGHYSYQITRLFTATDACGRTRTASQIISVVDNQGPNFSGYQDTTILCNTNPPLPAPTSLDLCSGLTGPPVLYQELIESSGICVDNYTRVRYWKASDVCNNMTTFTQNVHVIDTIPPILSGLPPNVTVQCNNIPGAANSALFGRSDNCDSDVSITFFEYEVRSPDLNDCAHWADYQIMRAWTASDNCGNQRTYTQTLFVEDKTGPVLIPPGTLNVPSDLNLCGANVGIPAPFAVYDDCTAQYNTYNLKDTVKLISSGGGNPFNTPVDTVVFQWTVPNTPPFEPVVNAASLTLFIDNADINATSEYFNIYGEDGTFIDVTNPVITTVFCTSSVKLVTIPAAWLNQWMADGDLKIRLVTNGVGNAAINPTCTNGRVRCSLLYQTAAQNVPITLSYSIDNKSDVPYVPNAQSFLDVGSHTIAYKASDCSGNTTTATIQVVVSDVQPPVIAPQAPIVKYIGPGNCTLTLPLPFPAINENCDMSGNLERSSVTFPLQFEYDPDADTIPKAINLPINGLIPNAFGNGRLRIRFRGDNSDDGEFFYLQDEYGGSLGKTQNGNKALECSSSYFETFIDVTAAQINSWANDGATFFRAIPNNDVFNFPDAINNCNPLLPDQTDGISRIQAILEYSYAEITYEIRKNNTLYLPPGPLIGSNTQVTLDPGVYVVKYIVSDNHGLEGTTTFTITVRDTIKPVAKCLPTTIYTSPSGLNADHYFLQPTTINNGSTDNCPGTLTMQLSQSEFTCNMATPPNNIYPITLTVTDAAGNTATCQTSVQVLIQSLTPYFDPVCEGGTLKLFADANLADPNNIYDFTWKNPAGITVFPHQRNPTKANAQISDEGLYTVTAIGSSGCIASGVVDVKLTKLPIEPMLQSNTPICQGDSIYLSTNSYNGQNVFYKWYSVAPSGINTLLDSTQTPFLLIPAPLVGNYTFFVKVSADGCSSVSSQQTLVIVKPRPSAVINPPVTSNIRVCFGQPIVLGSSSQGSPGNPMTYSWMGPAGFTSQLQNPPAILSAAYENAGTYKLVTKVNGCESLPALVQVLVDTTPPKPIIAGQNKICQGGNTTLVSNVMGIGYIWERISPPLQITTTSNALTLSNQMLSDNACWRVRVVRQFCSSEWSDNFCINVQAYPDVAAPSLIKICNGDTLKLSATGNQTGLKWAWSGPAAYASFEQNPIRVPGVSGDYKVIGKNDNGCADSAVVNVQISPSPIIDLVSNNAPACPDGTTDAVLTAVINTASPPLMYFWYHPTISPVNLFSTDPIPVIPDVSGKDNGPYLLVVKDSLGCVSLTPGSTIINVGNPLSLPVLKLDAGKDTVCAGTPVTISVMNAGIYQAPVTYFWTVPWSATPIATTDPFISIPSAQVLNSGLYQVKVQSANCMSSFSAVLRLTVYDFPPKPVPVSNAPVCNGSTLKLWISNLNNNPAAQYYWTGPGYTSTSPNSQVIIPGVTENQEGNWTVKVTLHGCTSFAGEPLFVRVDSLPKRPFILSPDPARVCKNDPMAFINLLVSSASLTSGASYTWVHVEKNDTISGPLPSGSLYISNLNGFGPGTQTFKVVATQNGCSSEFSDPVSVILDTIPPNLADAGPSPRTLCNNQELRLAASPPTQGITGLWKQIGMPPVTIVNPDAHNSKFLNFTAGNTYQFVWSLTNGGCKNFDSDTCVIKIVAPEKAMVPDSYVTACAQESFTIHSIQGQTVPGIWLQDENQTNALKIKISDPDSTTTTVSNLVPGSLYFFYWTLPDFGCGVDSVRVTLANYSGKPSAGKDKPLCSTENKTVLNATELQRFETGKWISPDPSITFTPVNAATTIVGNLKPGPNIAIWVINNDACGNNSRDTVIINYQLLPTAIADVVEIQYGASAQFNVLNNDILPQSYGVSVTTLPTEGSIKLISPGVYTYQASAGFTGSDQMIYQICNLFCPDTCSRTMVNFVIGPPEDCIIPTIITPNNDNLNETFIIPSSCFIGEGEINVEVSIFNQWGDLVYHNEKYDNNNGWDGKLNGAELPVGTYFYVIQIQDESKPKTGFVLIQR